MPLLGFTYEAEDASNVGMYASHHDFINAVLVGIDRSKGIQVHMMSFPTFRGERVRTSIAFVILNRDEVLGNILKRRMGFDFVSTDGMSPFGFNMFFNLLPKISIGAEAPRDLFLATGDHVRLQGAIKDVQESA